MLGGLLLTLGGPEIWRAIFALNLPLGAAALVLLYRYTLPDPGRPGTPVDLPGAGLATLGLGLLAWALTRDGDDAALLGAAAVALILFLWREATAKAPMIRLGMFRNRGFALANLATLFLYVGLSGVMFYLPMTAISVWGVTPFGVTAAFLPTSVMITLLSTPAGRLADRIGPGPLMATGATLVAIGYSGLAWFAPDGRFFLHMVPFMLLVGFGMALVVAPLTAAIMEYADDSEQGAASGINNAIARASGLIAVALMGRIARWSYGAVTDETPGFGLPGAAVRHATATGTAFSHVAALAAALAAASALTAVLIGRKR